MSVPQSVRDVPVLDENGLIYSASNTFTKFPYGHNNMWGKKNSRFSTNKSLYLADDIK